MRDLTGTWVCGFLIGVFIGFALCSDACYGAEIAFGPGNVEESSSADDTHMISGSIFLGKRGLHEMEIGHVRSRWSDPFSLTVPAYEFVSYQRRFYTRPIKNTKFRFFASFGAMMHNLNDKTFDCCAITNERVDGRSHLPLWINFREKLGFRWMPGRIGIEGGVSHDSNSGLVRPNIGENTAFVKYVVEVEK